MYSTINQDFYKEPLCEDIKDCYYKQLNCYDPRTNNGRCISYNNLARDYERDLALLKQLQKENKRLKEQLNAIQNINRNTTWE